MNDQVLELICKLANKLREYEAANRDDSTQSWPAEVAAKFLLDHTDERNLKSNINPKSLSSLQKETAARV
jgi:hypothetical protein